MSSKRVQPKHHVKRSDEKGRTLGVHDLEKITICNYFDQFSVTIWDGLIIYASLFSLSLEEYIKIVQF